MTRRNFGFSARADGYTPQSVLNGIDRAIACIYVLAAFSSASFVLLLVSFLVRGHG
jgi:hypothetical protein